jgi:plasmid stabilization system protein ParE
VKIEIGKRASRQVERASSRWQQHRPSAPFLFEQELEEGLRLLFAMPKIGMPYPTVKRPELRRLLLARTEYRVYYALERGETVIVIHSVWGHDEARARSCSGAHDLLPNA